MTAVADSVRSRLGRLGLAVAVAGSLLLVPDGAPADAAVPAPRQRVEIESERTEAAQVFLEPDGSRTVEQHLRPVRARTAAGWQALDLTLRHGADGVVAPVAATVPMSFSGGGAGPFVRFGKPGASFELGWPDPLPAPVLSGPTATYPGVLPGVDLQVTARDSGFTHLLVVHTPEAARNPRLARITFGTRTDGLTLGVHKEGGLTATDPTGATVFRAPPAQMWESPATGPGASRAGEQCRKPMPVSLERQSLTVVPDQAVLTDPATRFPVRIDPGWDGEPGSWGLVYGTPEQYRGNACFLGDGDGVAKVGFSNWERPSVLVRSFFQYSVQALQRKPPVAIGKASLDAFQSYAPSCAPKRVELWQASAPYEPWTNWNNQPGTVRLLEAKDAARGYDASCPGDWLGFDVHAAAVDAVNGNGLVTLMLRAGNEGDRLAWRKFHPNPKLVINYNTPPERPAGLNADGAGCAVQPREPHLPTTTPQLNATAHDPDGGMVSTEFEWWIRGERPLGSYRTATQHTGTPFSATIPPGTFTDGSRIGWRVRAFDGQLHSEWSDWCDVTFDLTPPRTAPTVTSTDYPPDQAAGGIGRTGWFTLSAPGEADIARFRYRLSNSPLRTAEAVDGKAVVSLTPPTFGNTTVEVIAIDKAGNASPRRNYTIYVRSTRFPPVQHWRLDGKLPGTTVPDALGRGSTGTFTQGPVSWTGGRVGDALLFDGHSGQVGLGPNSTVHTGGSFSISAWVRLDRLDGPWQTFVSQDAEHGSSFYLQYRSDLRRWAFTMPEQDRPNFGDERVTADVPVRQGVWTHLVGVYDMAAEKSLRIYVDGRFAGEAAHTARWHKSGEVRIGRGKYNGAPVDFVTGAVDDVRVYDRVLDDGRANPGDRVQEGSDVHTLATKWPQEAGLYSAEENTGTQAGDTSGNHRHATAQPGTSWAPGRVGSGLRLDGSRGYLSTVDSAVRADTSFTVSAWVKAEAYGAESMTAVSQDGARAGGFSLGYDGALRRWVFGMHGADADAAVLEQSVSTTPPVPGVWTHLAGRYDAAAEEIAVFVNGEAMPPQRFRASWNAGGGLVIGRGKAGGAAVRHWRGEIDEVRVAEGLRTRDQIVEELTEPLSIRPLVRDGLNRYYGHNRDHLTTGGAGAGGQAPPGYHLEHELGWFAPEGAPDTVTLYSCLTGQDQFTSTEAGCEGFRRLAALGAIYRTPPPGEPTVPLMRCRTDTGEHFESVHADCEGKSVEFRLGHMRAYAPLVRYLQPDHPGDHLSGLGGVPTGYRAEWRLGILPLTARPGTRALESCVDGTDAFTSVETDCGGKTKLRTLGWVYTSPPAGLASARLLRCKQANGERFDTIDPGCEGQQLDAALGYVLTRL
ncbi:LamG-like jellyroll fold domain-containing protein [Crossiella sp. NPDC003009]